MNNNDQVLFIILYIIGFIVGVFITRAIFSIGTIVNHLKIQSFYLYELAKAQGVDENVLKKIATENEVYIKPQTPVK